MSKSAGRISASLEVSPLRNGVHDFGTNPPSYTQFQVRH
jgi:hypothetical protein